MTPNKPMTRPAPKAGPRLGLLNGTPGSGGGIGLVGKLASAVLGSGPRPQVPTRALPPRAAGVPSDLPAGEVTASEMAERLFETVKLLCELLDTENAALNRHDVVKVHELADRKNSLTKLYMGYMKTIATNRDVLEQLTLEQRQALKTLALRLDACVDVNGRLLSANIDASQRFMKVIVEAVREERTNISTYSAVGKMKADSKKGHETALALGQDI